MATPSPEELDFLAKLVALFGFVVAGVFLAADQPTRSAWVLLVSGTMVTLVEAVAIYRRVYD